MKSRSLLLALAIALAACSGQEERATTADDDITDTTRPVATTAAPVATTAPVDPAEQKRQDEEKKKAEEQKKLADDFVKLQKETESEKARFDEKVRKELADLSGKNFPSIKAALEASLKGSHRTPGAKDRDVERRPIEMMTFFGLKTDSHVLELDAGAGWYTEVLAPVVRKKGKLAVAGADPKGPTSERSTLYGQRLRALLDKAPELGEKVDYVIVDPMKGFAFDPAMQGKFDVVLAFRALHNWHRRNVLDKNLAEVHAVLKPGGVFAVEAHRAKPGVDPKESAEKGYLPQAFVVERAKAAGFELAAESEINANPKDTKDHPDGVWSLPPTLRGGEKDKTKFMAIGESDRMTLKFLKPKAPAAPKKK